MGHDIEHRLDRERCFLRRCTRDRQARGGRIAGRHRWLRRWLRGGRCGGRCCGRCCGLSGRLTPQRFEFGNVVQIALEQCNPFLQLLGHFLPRHLIILAGRRVAARCALLPLLTLTGLFGLCALCALSRLAVGSVVAGKTQLIGSGRWRDGLVGFRGSDASARLTGRLRARRCGRNRLRQTATEFAKGQGLGRHLLACLARNYRLGRRPVG